MKRELRNWNDFPVFPHLFDDWDANFFNDRRSMKTDVVKKDDNYEMKMEVPGFDKKDIQIEWVNGYLCVQADKTSKTNEKDDKGTIIRQERCGNYCARRFYVGDGYKQDDFKASYKNGELTITFPCISAAQRSETKQIEIH